MALVAALSFGICCALGAGALQGRMPRALVWRGLLTQEARSDRGRVWLAQAGLRLSPVQFWTCSLGVGIAGLLAVWATTRTLLVALVPAVALTMLPRLYYGRRRADRLRSVQAAWPDGLRELLSCIASGQSLTQALEALALTGPPALRVAFARFPLLSRLLGTSAALEVVKEELADPTSDRVVEVLVLAHERGGRVVQGILEDLVVATSRDLKVREEVETEGLESRINARAVLVLPWLVLVALDDARRGIPRVLPVECRARGRAGRGRLELAGLPLDQSPGAQPGRATRLRRCGPTRCAGSEVGGPMTPIALVGALATGLGAAGVVGVVVPPTARLGPRLRPYLVNEGARTTPDAAVRALVDHDGQHPVRRMLAPPLRAMVRALARVAERRSDDSVRSTLAHAGLPDVTPEEYRSRLALEILLFGGGGAVLGAAVARSTPATLVLLCCGAFLGATRTRSRLDRAIAQRRERIRLELATVNLLLAMHIRAGSGTIQATQRIVDRGRGLVVEELSAVLRAVRAGTPEPDAFRRAADLTPEASAARTYKLVAAGAERGVDLASGLRALTEDLRDSRREEIRRTATARRARDARTHDRGARPRDAAVRGRAPSLHRVRRPVIRGIRRARTDPRRRCAGPTKEQRQ